MSNQTIADIIAKEAATVEEAEAAGVMYRDLSEVTITRGSARTRTLQVRMNDDEYAALEALANKQHIPASTAARDILREATRQPQATPTEAIERIESALKTLRGSLAA
ncbi:MAG: hypothetical protein LBB54_04560 [Cellulomonadaceae bacterium]|jgi:hypothetical protein|nr:hypothetical protein [Cellulomonadaceae bacterium]